jgi:hypothetical protein
MLHPTLRRLITVVMFVAGAQAGHGRSAIADGPPPRLIVVDPPGGRLGASVDVLVSGSGLEGLTALYCDEPRIKATKRGETEFTIAIPADVPPGLYDLRALGASGLSSPRSFFVSPRATLRETEPKETERGARPVELDVSLGGRIDPPGDVDAYRFHARSGQRVVIECWAERLDSKLRAVLELEDERGRRLASSRGYEGLDPLIDFRAPVDGDFVVRVFDLTYTGSAEHVYRLDIDTGPRVELAWPNVVERHRTTRVTLFGRSLATAADGATEPPGLDHFELDVTPPTFGSSILPRTFAHPSRFAVEEIPVDFPGAPAPVWVGVTDVPVVLDNENNHQPETGQEVSWPCEVAGRLEAGDEKDWYRLHARRGDVVWLELFGERIGAPVDLDLSVLDAGSRRELLHLSDSLENPAEGAISTSHSDPSGRWVAPATGDYWIMVRNVIGGTRRDPRRLYRLSIRREEADFQLLAVPGGGQELGGWNVPRGGRAWIELVAIRRRGLSQPICVTASGLPDGFECPDVWLGPHVDRVPVIVSSSPGASREPRAFTLTGRADLGGIELAREPRVATVLSIGPPTASARLTGRIVAAAGPEAPGVVTATPSRLGVSQGTVIDLLVHLDLSQGWSAGPVTLTGIGTPANCGDRVSPDPTDPSRMWFSFQVPERLEPGPYTFAIRADSVLAARAEKPGAKPRTQAMAAYSNPMTIEVRAGSIDLRVDPRTPRTIKRGEVVQLRYRALRRNGFIGKVHAELYAPEGVSGLRARGVTFVGQTDSGVLQIAASDDAPLGRQPTLRLEAVGTVEDEPIHHVGCFVDLEITR